MRDAYDRALSAVEKKQLEIDPSYFAVLQQPPKAGRGFSAADVGPDSRVVVVDQAFVDSVLNGRNPIGVVGLKAGVVGGSFNNYGFNNLGNGGFNINGVTAPQAGEILKLSSTDYRENHLSSLLARYPGVDVLNKAERLWPTTRAAARSAVRW